MPGNFLFCFFSLLLFLSLLSLPLSLSLSLSLIGYSVEPRMNFEYYMYGKRNPIYFLLLKTQFNCARANPNIHCALLFEE